VSGCKQSLGTVLYSTHHSSWKSNAYICPERGHMVVSNPFGLTHGIDMAKEDGLQSAFQGGLESENNNTMRSAVGKVHCGSRTINTPVN
jgi:hypothetical protein